MVYGSTGESGRYSGSIKSRIEERRKGAAQATPLIYTMSALQNGAYPVTLNGKEYGLLFSLNALDAIQEKFGGYDKLQEILSNDNKDLFKNIKWLFALLINEARLADDENAELLTEDRVGRIVTAGNIGEIKNAIYTAFAKGASGDGAATGEDDEEAIGELEEDDEEGETKAGQEK